jgi:hypothetical protein
MRIRIPQDDDDSDDMGVQKDPSDDDEEDPSDDDETAVAAGTSGVSFTTGRKRKPVERYVAVPASGKLKKKKKSPAVEDGHGFLSTPLPPPPLPVATLPSMQDFLEDCQLGSYIDAMLEEGFDDVKFLSTYEREEDKNLKKILDAGVFPIVKTGHVMKLVSMLRKF